MGAGWLAIRSRFLLQVSRIVFSALPCDDLLEVGKFLAVDYRVSCLDGNYKIYRIYAYVAIMIWPVGFPLLCFAMLYYYEVPKIAAHKIRRAEERAFLQHWIMESARQSKPLTRIDGLELHELTHMQLYQLHELVTSFSTANNADAELELGISSAEAFARVVQGFEAQQSCAEPASSKLAPNEQVSGSNELSTALPVASTSLEVPSVQVGIILAPSNLRSFIGHVPGCS